MAWQPLLPSSSESVRLWGHVPAPRPVGTVRPARLAGVRSNHAGLRRPCALRPLHLHDIRQ